MTDIGANLAFAAAWSSEYPFIDRMKASSPDWQVDSLTYQMMDGDQSLIHNGYYTRLPDGASEVQIAVEMDPPALSTTDHYVITWSGTGTFRFGGATVLSTGDHTMTINFTGTSGSPTYDQLALVLTSIDPIDPIHDIHVVREDQVSLFNQGEIFNPAFINQLSGLDDLRFMDWGATNTNETVNWSDRTTDADRSWYSVASGAGVPIDVMVKLCNETHADMWYNVPTRATDDYVQHALQYIHDNLDPSLTVHVEYSNEMWNWAFQQSHYALTQGDNLFGHDVNGDGAIDSNDPAEHVGDGFEQFYGYRAAQIATIANGIWTGSDHDRLEMIVSSQTYNQLEGSVFEGVNKEVNGLDASPDTAAAAVASLFKDYAITGYYGGLDAVGQDPAKAAQILAWAQEGAAGLDAAFNEIEHGGSVVDPAFSLDGMAQVYQQKAAIAKAAGLNLVVYEGGLSADWSTFPYADQPLVQQFVAELKADPRMAALTAENIANFEAAGGTLFNAFNDAGGAYGTLSTIYDDDNPAWQAYKNAAAGGGGLHLTASAAGGLLSGGAGADWLVGMGGDDHLVGMAGSDVLLGGAGNDVLDGGAGGDRMTGGAGDDVYYVDDPRDAVFEQAGGGNDLVRASIANYTLTANVENLSFTGTMDHVGTGNDLANTITATSADDILRGEGGDDRLTGAAGDDVLDGGQGADWMYGGKGDDTFYVDNADDTVVEHAGQGTDTVIASIARYTLGSNVENLTFTGTMDHVGTGNALANAMTGTSADDILRGEAGADRLTGAAGDDVLDGGQGADWMYGGQGDDTFYVDNSGDSVVEHAGQGTDTVIASIANYTLGANVEDLSFTGTMDHSGKGNSLANAITGTSANDVLLGENGDDRLTGAAGNDVLNGGKGADWMYGGQGNDTFYVDNAGDTVVEHAGQGTDKVIASIAHYTLAANVENLLFTGTMDHVGIGNALDNAITGTSADDTLSGQGGDDRLNGMAGDDVLSGGAGNDWIQGGAGDDTIIGGAGQDILRGGAGADTFVFSSGDGATSASADRIKDFSHKQGDKIDLTAFEHLIKGDHEFHFIGKDAFSGEAGELQVTKVGSSFLVGLDVDGDKHADFMVMVASAGHLAPTLHDFVL